MTELWHLAVGTAIACSIACSIAVVMIFLIDRAEGWLWKRKRLKIFDERMRKMENEDD